MNPTLRDLSSRALAGAVKENAVALWRAWAAWPKAEYRDEDDRSLVVSSVPHPAFNHLFRLRLPHGRIVPFLRRALEPFRERSVPCFCWIDPVDSRRAGTALEEAGMEYALTAPGMAVDLAQLGDGGGSPAGVSLDEVVEGGDLDSWCAVVSRVTAFPPEATREWLELHHALPFGPGHQRRHFLARRDGNPIGTASLLYAAGAAGLYSVCVDPEHRRRGIGTALSARALGTARREGWRAGVLIASPSAAGIYRRLGFGEYRRWECWSWRRR